MTITVLGQKINSKDILACYMRKYKDKFYLTMSVKEKFGDKRFNGEFEICSYENEEDARDALSSFGKAISDSLTRKVSYEITEIHT